MPICSNDNCKMNYFDGFVGCPKCRTPNPQFQTNTVPAPQANTVPVPGVSSQPRFCAYPNCRAILDPRGIALHYQEYHGCSKHSYPCQYQGCDYCTTQVKDLEPHIWKVHRNETPYACDKCGKRFYAHHYLNQHNCEGQKCEYMRFCAYPNCSVRLDPKKITLHYQSSHGCSKDSYPCQYLGCDYCANQVKYLEPHIWKNHRNERPYACDKCGKRFYSYCHISTHVCTPRSQPAARPSSPPPQSPSHTFVQQNSGVNPTAPPQSNVGTAAPPSSSVLTPLGDSMYQVQITCSNAQCRCQFIFNIVVTGYAVIAICSTCKTPHQIQLQRTLPQSGSPQACQSPVALPSPPTPPASPIPQAQPSPPQNCPYCAFIGSHAPDCPHQFFM